MALSLLASELHLAICLRSLAQLRGVLFLRQMHSNCRRMDLAFLIMMNNLVSGGNKLVRCGNDLVRDG